MTLSAEALEPFLRSELARRRIADFGELMLPDYERARHTDAICDRLEAVERGELRRLILCLPPRHGKSVSAARLFPAWALGRDPRRNIVLASYGAELAEGHSRAARAFVASERFPFPETRLASDSTAVARWNTSAGGGMLAVGVHGALTGFGADVAIVDDAFKDRAEADSEAIREAVWRWFGEVLLTRLSPRGAVILVGTRWHPDDLIGRVLASPGSGAWEVLSLPAIAESDDDPLGRREGEPLWDRYAGEYESFRVEKGARAWAALYQQRPAPAEGSMFRRAWLEGRYAELPRGPLKVVTAVDASFGKSVQSDYSAIVTLASDGPTMYVVGAVRGRWDFSTLCRMIEQEAALHLPSVVLVEDASAGISAVQELRRTSSLPVVAVKPQGSKLARAEAITGMFESGRVVFPAVATRWRDELIEELASFPAGRYDDMTDACVYALERLRRGGGSGAQASMGGYPGLVHDLPGWEPVAHGDML